jgi:hypothetical protein
MSILTEFQSRIELCSSIEDYDRVLKWGISKIKQKSESDKNYDEGFRDPIAAMMIEVYMACPEVVVNRYQKNFNSYIYA